MAKMKNKGTPIPTPNEISLDNMIGSKKPAIPNTYIRQYIEAITRKVNRIENMVDNILRLIKNH